jgi:tRNA nucleotidyltransferase (CCA-adding enzyme)
VDVTPFRASCRREDLERRDFTVNAIAWDPATGDFDDPTGGRGDLAAKQLRTPGRAVERLAEDPLRALRAARLAAQLDLHVAPELETALATVADRLAAVAAERVRAELERLLALPEPGEGLALLRRSGLEAVLVPEAGADCAEVVGALPADVPLRLAAWLRGTQASRLLARWRIAGARQREIERLLALHPIDAWAAASDSGARRLRRRAASAETVRRLVALRRAEAAVRSDTGVQAHLDALEAALERTEGAPVAVADLALGGRDVVAILGTPPGPAVGRALHHLVDCVVADPACNTKDALRARLEAWARNDDSAGSR